MAHRAWQRVLGSRRQVRAPSCCRTRTSSCVSSNTTVGHCRRFFFTNTDQVKRDDPYQQLGLQWGDGATTAEIRQAYRQRAAVLHPDVNTQDAPAVAQRKFQDLKRAYETLIHVHSHVGGSSNSNTTEQEEQWRVRLWRNGDRIAVNRTDVAGVRRKRPVPPAETAQRHAAAAHRGALLGHPSGLGAAVMVRGEYLSDGGGNSDSSSSSSSSKKRSSSVGRGRNKWVTPKEFVPWNGKVKVSSAAAARPVPTRTTSTNTPKDNSPKDG